MSKIDDDNFLLFMKLKAFVEGKTVEEVIPFTWSDDSITFDLKFTDGSVLEMFAIVPGDINEVESPSATMAWVLSTKEEVDEWELSVNNAREEAEDERVSQDTNHVPP